MPSADRFERLFQDAPCGIGVISLDGRWELVNRALCESLGYPPEELVGDSLETFIHPGDFARGQLRERLISGEIASGQADRRFVCRDGTVIWFRISLSLTRDEHGAPEYFVAHCEDVSATKAVEQEHARERLWLAESQSAGRIGSWELDLETGEMRWSHEQFNLYGVDPANGVPGLDQLLDLVHADDRTTVVEMLRTHVASGEDFIEEYRAVHPELGTRTLLVRGRFLARDTELGRPARMAGTTLDVTAERTLESKRRRDEQRLLDNERQLYDAQALAHVGSWEWDVSSERPTWTAEMARIYGYDVEHVPNVEDLVARVHPEDRRRIWELIEDARSGYPTEADYRIVRPGGEVRHVHGRHRTRADDDGFVTHIYGAVQDVTERKRYEADLERLATHDSLTGLANRRTFEERLAMEMARARRDGTALSLAVLDIDYFKRINDTLGHQAGDEVLQLAAAELQRQVRSHELIARIGGEEFGWILPGADEEGARIAVERGRSAVAAAELQHIGPISFSAGVAALSDGVDAEELYRRADMALLEAKASGRDRVMSAAAMTPATGA